MNILYFHAHDQGRYVQPYGHPVSTPRLQRFAEEGVLFRRAFCAAPSCSPSRAALLTGQYPHQCGMYGLTNQGWRLDDYEKHLRKTLSDADYETALCGIHHVTDFTEEGFARLGYDRLIEAEAVDPDSDRCTAAAIDYLREKRDRPFFLALGHVLTHQSRWDRTFVENFDHFGALDTRYRSPLPGLPDTPEGRLDAALLARASEVQDLHFSRILDVLDELDLAKNTLVIYTTDHGPGVPRHKLNLNDGGTGVSLILRGPGLNGGKVIDALVSHLDIFPTLCELLGIHPPPWLEGRSLMPLVRGECDALHEAIFMEQNYHGRFLPLRSVRTDRYRYVRRIGQTHPTDAYSVDNSLTKAFFHEKAPDDSPLPEEQLFDLLRDPLEFCNLASNPRCAAILADLREKLETWMERTDDPARLNAIPEPPEIPTWSEEAAHGRGERRVYWENERKRCVAAGRKN